MRTCEPVFRREDPDSPQKGCGPLPRRDSVQSLVSLMQYPVAPSTNSALDDLSVRGVDDKGQFHSVPVTSETEFISLSSKGLKTITLCALNSVVVSSSLREISLAANSLELVDLSPLSACRSLAVLSLNSNNIITLDLTPLASCIKLERLWLHDNHLEHIDLSPLKSCRALRSLYLEDNSLHEDPLDLSPLSCTQNLRSLRLGGNRLGGKLDTTALLHCPALSVFNIDSSVVLVSDGESCQARVSPALRRVVLDIKFTGRPVGDNPKSFKERTSPPITPNNGAAPNRLRRKVTPPTFADVGSPQRSQNIVTAKIPSPIVKVLLIGFRRLARYAAEDAFAKCGKVMIRAADQDVPSRDPGLILDSHLIMLYAPSEKTLRHVTVVVGRIPTAVIGTERYRSSADGKVTELLEKFRFCVDPLDPDDTRVVYNMGRDYACGCEVRAKVLKTDNESNNPDSRLDSSPVSEEDDDQDDDDDDGDEMAASCVSLRKSYSESCIPDALSGVNIELEDIEDEDEPAMKNLRSSVEQGHFGSFPRSRSVDGIRSRLQLTGEAKNGPVASWSEVAKRLQFRKGRRTRSGLSGFSRGEMSVHSKNKLRAERAAIEVAFSDLAGYATVETCAGIARSCGLPKCAGSVLFGAAFGSSFEIESTTPEAGVPNIPMERKNRRISAEAFLAYWDSRLKSFDGEERLSNILEDCHSARTFSHGVEDLITSFMEGRSSRFGSFALVKISEAIAIGSALVMYGLRGTSKNRVGGQARPVCPKEIREGKLNAALIAAEAGIFEGVASGLSMDQIRSVKGSFATEASAAAVSRCGGLALSYTLCVEDVKRYCLSRKTLLPGAVEKTMSAHCVNSWEMTLSEFSIFLSVLSNISSNGAVDYFFTVVDTDQNEMWTLPDLRHFHMEKEKMWLKDGMAVSDLVDLWVNLIDMIRPARPKKGISRREFAKLGPKERKIVLQSLLFVDDDHSLLNVRRTMEMNQGAASPLVM